MTDVRLLVRLLDLVSEFNELLQLYSGFSAHVIFSRYPIDFKVCLQLFNWSADVLCDPMPLEWVLKSILPRALKQW